MKKKVSVSIALAITLIAMTVTFSITMILSMNIFDSAVNDVTEKQAFYSKISEIDTYVRGNYFGDIEDDTLFDSVARGFVDGLNDPYSTYYTAEEYAVLQGIESGNLVNIGLVAQKDVTTGYFNILKVYPESPAEAAGITEGLWITAVDDTLARNVTGTGALNSLLRGEQGTTVTVYTEQPGLGEEGSFSVQRVNYTAPTVEAQVTEDNYGYIRIFSFAEATASDFDYALREAIDAGVKGFVFDLRGTNLGYVEYSYDMIDQLCPLGTISRTLVKSNVKRVQRMSDAENFVDLPMVCLVDNNTAGAAELFAACVRDLSGGQIVGENTAGKGTLQTRPQQLSDGSAIALTYAQLYTGDEENEYTFDSEGLAPDIEVAADYESDAVLYTPDFQMDSQLVRALELVRTLARAAGLEGGDSADATDVDEPASAVDGGTGTDEPDEAGTDTTEEPADADGDAAEAADGDEPADGAGDEPVG